MIKVLFVCLGNICRSPMAEAVFKDMVEKEGLADQFYIDSAGISGWHEGERPHRGTLEKLAEVNISSEGIRSRQIRTQDLTEFDYILAMDDENLSDIHRLTDKTKPGIVIKRLMDYVDGVKDKNIPDPWYTGDFDETYSLVTKGCKALLESIKNEQQLN